MNTQTAPLFYANRLVDNLSWEFSPNQILSVYGEEIYNGGYIYTKYLVNKWWRCDFTPVLLADVPKELQLLVLLME